MQQNSFQNLLQNLTKKQKISIIIFFMVIILLLFYVYIISNQSQSNTDGINKNSDEQENINFIKPDSSNQESNNTYIQNLINNNYQYSTEDPNHYYPHTTDPNLLSTFLPHAESVEYNINGNITPTVLYYIYEDGEQEKTIGISIAYCNEEEYKKRAQNYLNSIPLDLSEYTIKYEVTGLDTYCQDEND